jgi:hypothetical protein
MGVHRLVGQRGPDLIVGMVINERGRSAGGIRCGSYRTPLSRFVTSEADSNSEAECFP